MLKKVITHNGSFHADDVFAVATLQLVFGVENIEVIRTRDEAVIATGDIVVDVGGVYDPAQQRFDHHQNGAPVRDNGIPYAAFGLIWKQYGEKVSGSKEAAEIIERRLVVPIDAGDNGFSLFDLNEVGVWPVLLQDVVSSYKPEWGSEEDIDNCFNEVCDFACKFLKNYLRHAGSEVEQKKLIESVYSASPDKRVLSLGQHISSSLLSDYPEVMFLVYPDNKGKIEGWVARTISKENNPFESRKPFPDAWRGLKDSDLINKSGIADAIFCHKAGFLFVAKSKEGALEAVNKALG